MHRNIARLGLAAVGLAAMVGSPMIDTAQAATDFPGKKPISMIVPFGAGGPTDAVGRFLANAFEKILKQNVVVKNLTGAAGTIGTAELAKADADGYTLGYIPIGPMATQPHLRKLPYELGSFEAICRVVDQPNLLVAKKDGPHRTVDDIVKDAKAHPNALVYVAAPGGMPHISMIAFNKAYGLQMKQIPGDTAEAAKHIAAGTAQFHSTPPDPVSRYDLRGVAFFAEKRLADYPDVPTFRELGKDLVFTTWFGVFAPKGTPSDTVAKLGETCKQATDDASFKSEMAKMQSPISYLDSAGFKAYIAKQYDVLGELLQEAGLKK